MPTLIVRELQAGGSRQVTFGTRVDFVFKVGPVFGQFDFENFYDLPESIKQELPAIIVSAHIYSTNPAQRSIVINDNFMEEGGYVLDGLILFEITLNGAIFNYQGTLFSYGVVSGWQ